MYHSNNWSISSKLSISLAYTCFLYSLTILCISVMSVATSFSTSNFIEFNPLPFILDGSGKRSITFAYPLKEPAFSFIHFSSVTQLCLTICNPMEYSTPAFPVHHQLLELTQTHVRRVSDVLQSSHPLSSPSPLTFNISQHQGFFSNESVLRIRWPKYWSFSFNISPFNEHPGLISFRMDWLDLLAVQGTLKSLLQHHSSKASSLRRSAFCIVQLSHP